MFKLNNARSYLKLAQQGGGYAVGLVYDPKNPEKDRYAFLSPRAPGDFKNDTQYVVSSNKKFLEMQAQENILKADINNENEGDRKFMAYERNRNTGAILAGMSRMIFPLKVKKTKPICKSPY